MEDRTLKRISSDVTMLVDEESSEENIKSLMELFYELAEELGYSDTMIVTPGAYDEEGEVVFQSAFKTDEYIDESVKIFVKFIDKGEDVTGYNELVSRVASYQMGADTNRTVYFLVSNLISIKI